MPSNGTHTQKSMQKTPDFGPQIIPSAKIHTCRAEQQKSKVVFRNARMPERPKYACRVEQP
eukprot:1161350-Pelagomonas_calceolata.AAC.12